MITSFFKPKAKKHSEGASPASLTSLSSDSSAAGTTMASGREGSNEAKRPRSSATTTTTNDSPVATSSATAGGSPSAKKKRAKKNDNNDPKAKLSLSPDAVEELISHLEPSQEVGDGRGAADASEGGEPPAASSATPTWKSELARHFSTSQFASLAAFVAAERRSRVVYPAPADTWTALNACPLSSLKVVVVGQDPYHGPDQAHGLSFSVARNQAVPPSLRNIYRELRDDPGVPDFDSVPAHGNLTRWARQGVLLLNAVLTVRSGEPNSHAKRGWEATTDAILRAAANRRRGGPVVFLLWGKPALAKAQTVLSGSAGGGSSRHVVICTSHPSPLGATKTSSPFLGSRCFSRCNQALVGMGLEPVDWNVDGPL
jgi:uracil-DNA glycosylase